MTQRLRIAVVGLGRAGGARVRALEDHPAAELAGIVRSNPDTTDLRWQALLDDPTIDAAIICTPNHLHSMQARALLEAGKHVAVEFPLAPNATEARALFELAQGRQRVLHVEHIELLSPSQLVQRNRVITLGRPRGGSLAPQR